MNRRTRNILTQVGGFALAGLLLYLALRGVDLQNVLQAFREADYRWAIPLVAVTLGSHALRAWRWQVLIDALPTPSAEDADARPERATFGAAFSSLIIGYMVNYAAPRLGEVARTANLSRRTKLGFSGLFGTVVVERMLDMAVLAAALLTLIPIYSGQLAVLRQRFLAPAVDQVEPLSGITIVLVVIGAIALLGLMAGGLWWWIQREGSALRQIWTNQLQPALVSFRDGLLTLLRARRRGVIVGTTLGIWAGYAVMAYLPLVMLHMAGLYDLGLIDGWSLMLIGALGLVVPSPGGLGSYHYVTILALVHLYSVPEAPAATYAVLTHAAQLVMYTLLGAVFLVTQNTSLKALRQRGAEETASSEASNSVS